MSILLNEIIKQRKDEAIEYEEYLKQIMILVKQVNTGINEDTPKDINSSAKRALYHNLNKDTSLAIELDALIRRVKKADFRGNITKEREIQSALYERLQDEDKVREIFKIILEQKEY